MLNVSHQRQLTWQIFWEDFGEFFQNWCNVPRNRHLDIWLSLSSHECITSKSLTQTLFNLIMANKLITILLLPLSLFFSGTKVSTFPLSLLTPFSCFGGFDWLSISFTFLSLWMNEHWLVRPCMVTSKSNNHGRPKIIWPTFIRSMSHHTLSVYVANWMGIWHLFWTSMDMVSIHVTLYGFGCFTGFIPKVVIKFDATALMQLPLSITLQFLLSIFVQVWKMTIFLRSLDCSGWAKVHLTTPNWVWSKLGVTSVSPTVPIQPLN